MTLLLWAAPAMADAMVIDDFSSGAETRWRFISDQVMGGVSEGKAGLGSESATTFVKLRGTVSTANNGGFIQIRQKLSPRLPADASGISLRVRGYGAKYYIHLRPDASRKPWQYFQANFPTTPTWQVVTLPWAAFTPQGGLSDGFAPQDIRSLGIVAYGADFEAALDVDWIGTLAD